VYYITRERNKKQFKTIPLYAEKKALSNELKNTPVSLLGAAKKKKMFLF
jgi:hypothetical protein